MQKNDVDSDNVYCFCTMTDTVNVPATRLDVHLRVHIASYLRGKYFNVCSKFGFIRDGPIDIVDISEPVVQLAHLNGDCACTVTFRAWVCNPVKNMHMRGTVSKINTFGVMAVAGPVQCLMPRNATSTKLQSSGLDELRIGDVVVVCVHGSRYELLDTAISAVCTLATEEDLNNDLKRLRERFQSNAEHPRSTADDQIVSDIDTDEDFDEDETTKKTEADADSESANEDDEYDEDYTVGDEDLEVDADEPFEPFDD